MQPANAHGIACRQGLFVIVCHLIGHVSQGNAPENLQHRHSIQPASQSSNCGLLLKYGSGNDVTGSCISPCKGAIKE